jgi:hypothetical protein
VLSTNIIAHLKVSCRIATVGLIVVSCRIAELVLLVQQLLGISMGKYRGWETNIRTLSGLVFDISERCQSKMLYTREPYVG